MKTISTFILLVGLLGTTLTSPVLTPDVAAQSMSKIHGIILNSDGNSLTVRSHSGSEVTVLLADTTKVQERKSNPFRGSKQYSRADLIRGLDIEIEGRNDSTGALVAQKIKVRDNDMVVARTINTQVMPIERRLGDTENRLNDTEQNAMRLSGQMSELVEISNMARGGAKAAQDTADSAVAGVQRTNSRISALDDYDVRNDIIVNFKVGSAKLSPEAQTNLDDIANAAKDQTGFVIEIAGFASADGNVELNRRLSQRRADAVVRYLVEQHAIPVRRILTPYGYGELNPVADNSDSQGRIQNRRVEVRLLVNRGLTMPVDASQTLNQTDTTSQTQVN